MLARDILNKLDELQLRWKRKLPKECEWCGGPLSNGWVDGKTENQSFAVMCQKCFKQHGTGTGQQYDKDGVGVKLGDWE